MRYQDIRKAFPSCGIAVTQGGIMLIFPNYIKPRDVMQTIDEREFHNKDILMRLMNDCDSICLRMTPGIGICILFEMGIPIENNLIWNPITPAKTGEELTDLTVRLIMEKDGGQQLIEAFSGIDTGNPYEVLEALYEHSSSDSPAVLSFRGIQSWEKLQETASRLQETCRFGDYEEEPPDEDLDFGVVSWFFETPDNVSISHRIKDDQKRILTELCEIASTIALSGCSRQNNARLSVEFYS